MAVCKFFLQGNCRFGSRDGHLSERNFHADDDADNCRNEHPGNNNSGGQNQNRFGALANNGGGNRGAATSNAGIDLGIIQRDVPTDLDPQKARPKWIFSSYAPVKTAAVSLMEENEYSTEEIRLRYYLAASSGQGDTADQEATQMYEKINRDYQNILSNINDVPKFLNEGERKRPNRHDFTNVALFDGRKTREQFIQDIGGNQGSAFKNGGSSTSGFGTGSNGGAFGSGGSAFGQNPFGKPATSTFGQPAGPSAFGSKPAFGQSAAPAFGQSTFGQQPTASKPAFGASGFGQGAPKNPFGPATASSGFGQPSSTFGQPSQPAPAFGQPSQATSAFGQPPQPNPAFGQPSQTAPAFGQPAQPTSGFGQPSQPTSSFGQPSPAGSSAAFGQPSPAGSSAAFGQPSQPGANPFGKPSQPGSSSGFGQPSQPAAFGKPAFGATAQPNSIFGQGAQQTNSTNATFGQSTTAPSTSGFGQPNTGFGQQPTPSANPFGTTAPATSPFGTKPQPAPQQQQQTTTAPGGLWNPTNPLINKPAVPLHITQQLPAQPPVFDNSNNLTAFRGQAPVTYFDPSADHESNDLPGQYSHLKAAQATLCPSYKRPGARVSERIWFPTGSGDVTFGGPLGPDKRADFEAREEEYDEGVKEAYRMLYETGEFAGGKLPLVPPMRDWVAYDF